MHPNTGQQKLETNPFFSFACFLLIMFLARFGGFAMMLGSTGILSLYILLRPNSFRGRDGSLKLAFGLLATLWAFTVVVLILTSMGEIVN
jgi:hypothetical protein